MLHKKHTGIDSALQKQLDEETAKWREFLKCCLDVTLFLAERNLPFSGSTRNIGDHENGIFLGTLELISRNNKVLQQHLEDVRKHQEIGSRMNAHYLSWLSQNEFIEECGEVVLKAVVDEIQKTSYYGIIVEGTPLFSDLPIAMNRMYGNVKSVF